MDDPEYYRRHANGARRLAELASDPELKKAYQIIAQEFERVLAEIEGKGNPG